MTMQAPLPVNDATLNELRTLAAATLSAGPQRIEAENTLKQLEQRQGYVLLLLKLIESSGKSSDPMAAGAELVTAVLFKNFIKKYWDPDESIVEHEVNIPVADRELIKTHIVELMCTLPTIMQAQVSEAVRIISLKDYPHAWPGLLPELTKRMQASQDVAMLKGLLETANVIFKMFRHCDGSATEVRLKLKATLEGFQAPWLQMYVSTLGMLTSPASQSTQTPEQRKQVLGLLRLLCRIFFSLSCVDIPEFFEDNLAVILNGHAKLMEYTDEALEDKSNEDEAGPVELVHQAVMENLQLYSERYDEMFAEGGFLPQFTRKVWELLSQRCGPQEKYDAIVCKGMDFLRALVMKLMHQKLFEGEALTGIFQHIVLPNISLRPCDMERFEMNPVEFVRRDIEGSDTGSRRKTASDLLRAMTRHFDAAVTQMSLKHVQEMVATGDPMRRGGALVLATAIGVRQQLRGKGVTEVNPGVPILDIVNNLVVPGLTTADGQNVDEANPMFKADCLKFLTEFRNQIPRETILPLIPVLVRYVASPTYVLHTYAAYALTKLLTVKDTTPTPTPTTTPTPTQPRYHASDLSAHHTALFTNLFAKLDEPEFGENEFMARAILRVIVVSRDTPLPVEQLLNQFQTVLARVCKEPKNPTFNHFLFESIAALIKFTCKSQPQAVHSFEGLLFPPFTEILQNEIAEFTPFVYQILAQLLELGPDESMSEAYQAIYKGVFHRQLYTNAGNIPGLVRLVEAYMRKYAKQTVATNVTDLLGCVQFLMNKRTTEPMAFRLLVAMIEFIDPSVYQAYLTQVFTLAFQRMQSKKSPKTGSLLTNLVLVFVGKHGPPAVVSTFETIQPGLFIKSFVPAVLLSNVNAVALPSERRASAVGLTRLLCEYAPLLQEALQDKSKQCSSLWGQVLKAQVALLSSNVGDKFSLDDEGSLESMEETGYTASFSRLVHSQTQVRDHFKSIPNTRVHFAQALMGLTNSQADVQGLIQQALSPEELTSMQSFFKEANIAQ